MVALLPFAVISLLSTLQVRQSTRIMIEENLANLSSEIGAEIEKTIFSAYTHIKTLAENPIIKSEQAKIEEKLVEMQKTRSFYKVFEEIALLNLDGVVLASTTYEYRGAWKYKDWFLRAKAGEAVVSPVHAILRPFRLVMITTAPIIGEDGTVKAVLAGRVNMQRIWEITDRVKIGKTGFIFVTDREGNFIAFPDKDKLLHKLSPESLRNKILINQSGTTEYLAVEGTRTLCYYMVLKGYEDYKGHGWRIGIAQDTKDAYAIIDRMQIQVLLVAVGGLVFILLLSSLLSLNIVRPVKALVKATERIAKGNLNAQVSVMTRDEIGDLGNTFNKMTEDLKRLIQQEGELLAAGERAAIIDTMPDGLIVLDFNGVIHSLNPAIVKMLGYTPEERIGKSFDELRDSIKAEDIEKFTRLLGKLIKTGHVEPVETVLRAKDGKKIPMSINYSLIKDADGNPKNIIAVLRDITERKNAERELKLHRDHLEDMVKTRTSELKRVNKELRNLTLHLQSVREEEQTRISRQIHDELGQQLYVLKMGLSWLGQELPKAPQGKSLHEEIKSMLGVLDSAVQKIRTMSRELRPAILDDLGIVAAIKSYAREFNKRTGIDCEVSFPRTGTGSSEDITLDKKRSTTIFRIFQEALTNVARHANATKVKIDLQEKPGGLTLEVKDNGKGVTKREISTPKAFGIVSMRERALFWGGNIEIKGIPCARQGKGKGTTVILNIPKKMRMQR